MRDYIVFGEDWGRHPSSTQHIVRHLQADCIVWCNSVGLRKPSVTRKDIGRAVEKVWSFVRNPAPAGAAPSHVTVVHPLAIPAAGSAAGQALNRVALKYQIERALPNARTCDPVVWISVPSAAPVARSFGRGPVVYYCGDDFTALNGVDHVTAAHYEQQLAATSDVIFAASPQIARRFQREKTMLLPHGVDVDLFTAPKPRPRDLPSGRPIAGFYGAIAPWIDFELIAAVSKALPDWWIVLIGPMAGDASPLGQSSNVVWLGKKAHASLAAYVQHWDVSLIPFRDTPQIAACNPLKLREYLAAGTPIVSTRFPAVRTYEHLVTVADRAGFAAAIRDARHDRARAVERQRSVAGETWASRAAYVEQVLDWMTAGIPVSQLARQQHESAGGLFGTSPEELYRP